MNILKTVSLCLVSCALCLGSIAGAHAQQYPSKPVRFICPFAPGGGTDVLARMLSAGMMETFGQAVIVDNRPGAGGVIGADLAAKAPADGYTIVLGSPGSLTINPNLQKVPYDSLRDFAPITLATISPFVLVVNPSATAGIDETTAPPQETTSVAAAPIARAPTTLRMPMPISYRCPPLKLKALFDRNWLS